MSRTEKSIRNINFALISQFSLLFFSFLTRSVFANTLGSVYLGINGLFSNIIGILNITELGIGASITFSLYKPLAFGDQKKISAYMRIFKKAFTIIGVGVFFIGMLLMPFLKFFLRDIEFTNGVHFEFTNEIYLIFLLFIINASLGYFNSYKQSLLLADQKGYIFSLIRMVGTICLNLAQILVLVVWNNFILFLILQIIYTVILNFILSNKVGSLYPYLKQYQEKISVEEKSTLIKNIKAMSLNSISGVLVNSTDSILIALFANILVVGAYSNYLMIIVGLNSIYNMIFSSLSASIGNLNAMSDKKLLKERFETVYFISFWVYAFSSIALLILLNPFIYLWVGEEFLLSPMVVYLIVTLFYLNGMRKVVLVFKESLGLVWPDRYRALIESIINLFFSVIFGYFFGIYGVLLGTLTSVILTTWVEPYVLYKYGFEKTVKNFFTIYLHYFLKLIIVLVPVYGLSLIIPFSGIMSFLLLMIFCFLFSNLSFWALFSHNKNFIFILSLVKSMLQKRVFK